MFKKTVSLVGGYLRESDSVTTILCAALAVLSIVLQLGLYKAGKIAFSTAQTQIIACCLGVICAVILSKIDYNLLGRLWKLHTAFAYFLVALTFIIGEGRGEVDDIAWLMIPGTHFSIQPAEFLKISFIVVFAWHLSHVKEKINDIRVLALVAAHAAIPVLLIHFQGDDGTALMFAIMVCCMVFAAGVSWKYIAAAAVAVMVSLPILWFAVMDAEKRSRFMAVYSGNMDIQGTGWQQYYGKLSIGAGQLWGNGIFTGQGQFQTVPEVHNDFIFSFIGEALGFIGSAAVLLIFFVMCAKMLNTGLRCGNAFGFYICVGVFAMIGFQMVINVGMNLVLFPVVGITLPLLSSGGSSVLSTFLGIGLVQSVYMQSHHNIFGD
ncbi:MAG: FtsW/RodA/SpoVE family cell cycle protein [Oscillospiraceae bacterium]|nr:FtsW/RodA/SpoVE family cell cycle protein [Oscillospiraceae bacterium]